MGRQEVLVSFYCSPFTSGLFFFFCGRSRAARGRTIALSIRQRWVAAAVQTLCQVGKHKMSRPLVLILPHLPNLLILFFFFCLFKWSVPGHLYHFLRSLAPFSSSPDRRTATLFYTIEPPPTRNHTLGDDEGNQGKKSLFCSSS
jgi:hypothetical protein